MPTPTVTEKTVSHTPGNWNASGPLLRDDSMPGRVQGTMGGTIHVAHVLETLREGEREANAQLIAAAPDLLAVVRRFVEMYDNVRDAFGPSVRQTLSQADAAIAKAEGRP